MFKFRKVTSVVLASFLAVGLLAACSGKQEGGDASPSASPKADSSASVTPAGNAEGDGVGKEGFPISKEPIKLTFFAGKAASSPANWNDLPIWQEYAKMTNIQVDFQLTPADSLA